MKNAHRFLPSSNGCLSSLKTLPVTATADSFGPLLTCLISWGRGRDVLELIGNWLELTLTSRQKKTDEYAKEEEQDKVIILYCSKVYVGKA